MNKSVVIVVKYLFIPPQYLMTMTLNKRHVKTMANTN